MGTLARQGVGTTNQPYSVVRDDQVRTQLEDALNVILRAGVVRGGKVTKTGAGEVSLEAHTQVWTDGVWWDIGNNVVDPGPPAVLLGSGALPRSVAGTPSTSLYLYGLLTRTAADQSDKLALDTYAFVLSYSASAVPASERHIPLAVIPLDGSGNVTGSVGDVMPEPAGKKYLHLIPNLGYRAVSVAGTGLYTLSADDLAGGAAELTGVLTGNRQVEIAPEPGRFLPVLNSTTGPFSLTIRTPGTTGVVLAQGAAALLWVTPAGVVVLATTDLTLAGAAPNSPQFLTLAAVAGLTSERVLTPGGSMQGTDGGAGNPYTLDVKGNAGTPEGVVTAAVGALCRDTTNGDVYVKHTGAGNTGWKRLVEEGAAAGGDLTGTYPNPTVAAGAITDTKVAAANKDGAAGTASMRTLGTGAAQAAPGNDSRLSDARTPTAHHASHEPGGSDPMAVDAAAGVGSLRTLGTGATQAAPGNTPALKANNLSDLASAATARTNLGLGSIATQSQAAADANDSITPSAGYVQSEAQAVVDELHDLKDKLRAAGIILP